MIQCNHSGLQIAALVCMCTHLVIPCRYTATFVCRASLAANTCVMLYALGSTLLRGIECRWSMGTCLASVMTSYLCGACGKALIQCPVQQDVDVVRARKTMSLVSESILGPARTFHILRTDCKPLFVALHL